jgi:hypothetical protein
VNLLTTSRLRLHRACPRQHWYRYEMGRVPVAPESHALAFGTAIHAALEAWWKTWQTLDGIGALEAARDALPVDTDPYAAATAHALVIAYHARWARWAAGVEVLGVEQAFAAPLLCPTTGRAARTWQIAGKLDGLLRLADGRVAILEHKTTSSDARSGSDYRRRLTLDPQVGTYFEGCEALGTPAEVCVWDVLQKPAIRPLRATGEIKLKKDGQPRAGQRLTDETPEEYQERLITALGETGPEGALAHVEVHRLAPSVRRTAGRSGTRSARSRLRARPSHARGTCGPCRRTATRAPATGAPVPTCLSARGRPASLTTPGIGGSLWCTPSSQPTCKRHSQDSKGCVIP